VKKGRTNENLLGNENKVFCFQIDPSRLEGMLFWWAVVSLPMYFLLVSPLEVFSAGQSPLNKNELYA
jgi:hypothetical protein